MLAAIASNVVPLFPHSLPPVPEPDADLITAVLDRLESAWGEVVTIQPCRGLDRVRRVHVGVGSGPSAFLATLTPAQARLTAHCLFAEQAFAGCGDLAARLIEASVEIDHLPSHHVPASLAPAHAGVTGIGATFGLAALFLAAVIVPVVGKAFT